MRTTTLFLVLSLTACGSSPPEGSTAPESRRLPPPTAEQSAHVAAASNAFGLDLVKRARPTTGNYAISPASVWLALAMTEAGANGETETEMREALHFTSDEMHGFAGRQLAAWNTPSDELTLRVVNRLFGEESYDIAPAFEARLRDDYGAPLERVDFRDDAEGARTHINEWVGEQTNDRIRDLVPHGAVDGSTRLVLTNAVYFLGKWQSKFARHATRDSVFYDEGSTSRPTPTMFRRSEYLFAQTDGVKALEMPYRGGRYAMLIVLPDERTGIEAVQERFDAPMYESIVSSLSRQDVDVQLPKFEVTGSTTSLTAPLVALGMRRAFDARSADFTGMSQGTGERPLFLSDVLHQAFVRVDEEGTEAAASTAIVARVQSVVITRPEPQRFHADHPFLFLIRDTTSNAILFVGRVNRPRAPT